MALVLNATTSPKIRDELYEAADDAGLDLITGYSVSAYDPDMAILGMELVTVNTIFNPVNLTKIYEDANRKLVDLCANGIPSKIQAVAEEHGVEGELELLIVEESDD
jgi:hypothetical protein